MSNPESHVLNQKFLNRSATCTVEDMLPARSTACVFLELAIAATIQPVGRLSNGLLQPRPSIFDFVFGNVGGPFWLTYFGRYGSFWTSKIDSG